MNVNVVKQNNIYYATIETTDGIRYLGVYAHTVTKDEVEEDFREDKSNFEIIK